MNARERADRLDLVAEELDAERLAAGRREDVDQAAADGELAAVVDALDALVAGERERLGDAVDAELEAGAQLERLRAARRAAAAAPRARARTRRRARRARARRARAPARRRGAAAARAPTPSGRRGSAEADQLLAEEPRRRLGRVARVRVLRQQADERALEPLVERREHDRQRRLGHAGARRHRVGELGEALVLDELRDERM